jgi:diguanylate cyclase (GGDEF)-like protein
MVWNKQRKFCWQPPAHEQNGMETVNSVPRSILDSKGIASAVIDALSSHICVVDRNGVIVAVNSAWRTFRDQNSGRARYTDIGAHYLETCSRAEGAGSEEASEFARGVRSVLNGKTELFRLEYPCHSATEARWFLGRATPLAVAEGGAVISHMDITDRKLIEFELSRLAATDSLTGLPNRRFFIETANREVERVRRFGTSTSVVMIDLDFFKSVNDTYGHAMGDQTLCSFAQTCKRSLRPTDLLARLGGEEFAVLLPGADAEGGMGVAEMLRRSVAETKIEGSEGSISVTSSSGVTKILRSDQSIDDALRRADSALYTAKRQGRNRVIQYTDYSLNSQLIA